jgi:hypothetical protein
MRCPDLQADGFCIQVELDAVALAAKYFDGTAP